MKELSDPPCFILRFEEPAEMGQGAKDSFTAKRAFIEIAHPPFGASTIPVGSTDTFTKTQTRESPDQDFNQGILSSGTETVTKQSREGHDQDFNDGLFFAGTRTETRQAKESTDQDFNQGILSSGTKTETKMRETSDTDMYLGTQTWTETREDPDHDPTHRGLRAIPRLRVN